MKKNKKEYRIVENEHWVYLLQVKKKFLWSSYWITISFSDNLWVIKERKQFHEENWDFKVID